MKRAWYHFISIFGLTENVRERARKRLVKPLFGRPTGVCLGCGVDMFDGTDFCCRECSDFYFEYMESYGKQ